MDGVPYLYAEHWCKKQIVRGERLHGAAWLSGNVSCLLVVSKPLAKQYGIDEPSKVVVEGRPEGILIRNVQAFEVAPNYATNAPQIIQSPKEISENEQS